MALMSTPVQRLMAHFGCETRAELAALVRKSRHAVEKWEEKRRIPPIREADFKQLAVERGKPIRGEDFWEWCDEGATRSDEAALQPPDWRAA